jgi:predicted amidohydrolase
MRIAAVQMDVRFAEPGQNLDRMVARLQIAAQDGAQLVAFPECSLTGYCFESLEEAMPYGESLPGRSSEEMAAVCRSLGVYAVFGMLERDGDRLFNVSVLVGPSGLVAVYRKVHLPSLGVDRFTTPGDRPFAVTEMEGLRIGMNICYDSAFPEAARVLALEGVDLIVLPTNFPTGAECMAEHVINTRAMENHIYYACINRIGVERGFHFIGHSRICDPSGRTICVAQHTNEEILYADIEPQRARNKRVIRVPGKHEIHRFADRRPEMYSRILQR